MKLIIPMAGMGKRMRPHTLITPKPLLKIAGKSIVQRIVENLQQSAQQYFSEVHYIIGEFGKEVERELVSVAEGIGSKGFIHYQDEPLGTAHAVYCAKGALRGRVMIAFADTLFEGNFSIESMYDGIVWTMRVKSPENYGVVVTEGSGFIKSLAEKPKDFISDEAIIGIYYFREAEKLRKKIEYLIENQLRVKGEYQLTDALQLLLNDNEKLKSENIRLWLDCGNKTEFLRSAIHIAGTEKRTYREEEFKNCRIHSPVYIGKGIKMSNSVIGPGVILEDGCKIENSVIRDSIIYSDSCVMHSEIWNSMVGSRVMLNGAKGELNIGDYSEYETR